MQFKTIILLSFMTFFSFTSYSQCVAGAVNSAIWGPSPDDFTFGFTIDSDLTDSDTAVVVQGVDTTIVIQYLLPKKQAITSPISGTATVNSVQIQGVTGLPLGINWILDAAATANNNTYLPQTYRFGAVTMCGTTFSSPGVKTLTVSTLGCGSLSGISQCQPVSFPLYIEVLPAPPGGTQGGFTFTPSVGCNSLDVDFNAIFTSPDPILYPIEYNWDLGDGTTLTDVPSITSHNYSSPGTYAVEMTALTYEYYVSSVQITASGGWWSDIEEWGSGFDPELYGNVLGVTLPEQSSGTSQTWTTDIPITTSTVTGQFYDADNGAPFGSADDDLGASSNSSFVPTDGGTISLATGNYIALLTLGKRVSQTLTFNDTVFVYGPSTATASTSNGTLFCDGDSTILDLGAGPFDFVQWYNDTTLLVGETNPTLTVYSSGAYSAEILNAGNICPGNSNTINISIDAIGAIAIMQTASGLEIDNPNGHSVQWFSNGVPIPGATSDALTDLSSGNPFSVTLTNTNNCEASSIDFFAILAGTSTQSGNSLSLAQDVTFEAIDFSLCAGQEIAWAVSTDADGPITDMAGLQDAIDAGWVYQSTSLNTFDASCGNVSFPPGDYFMTPFSADAAEVEPVYWNANTDSGYCDAVMEICIGITGTDYAINPLTIVLPDGTVVDVLETLGGGIVPAGTPITPDLWLIATNAAGGSPLCIDLIATLGFYGDPNGTWEINVPNTTGTGALDFEISDFNIVVNSSSCDSLATDQIIPLSGVSGTIAAGATGNFTIEVPPPPTNFPEITPACLLFGSATTFNSTCVNGIDDIIDVENINLFPNPNNGLFNVEFDLNEVSDVTLSIVDLTGRTILNRNYSNAKNHFTETFDLKNNLTSGFYFLDIQIGNEHTQKKFIVR